MATAIFQKFALTEIPRGILKKTDTELFELTYILLRGISETKVCDVPLNMMEIPIRLISICIWAVKAAIAKNGAEAKHLGVLNNTQGLIFGRQKFLNFKEKTKEISISFVFSLKLTNE